MKTKTTMSLEDLVQDLKEAVPDRLESVVLYGSAAAGDHVGPQSDFNVLVVLDRLGLEEMNALAPLASGWAAAGNPPPLLFTLERLRSSTDVFPIEFLDIRDSHRILHGRDVVSSLEVGSENLRLQVEHELEVRLLQLRERYLLTEGRAEQVLELMIESLSSFLVLFRGALRLFQDRVPALKLEALRRLREHVEFDEAVFFTVERLKEGLEDRSGVDAGTLFEKYLGTIEQVTDAVDAFIRRGQRMKGQE